jgi:hypothetical protein
MEKQPEEWSWDRERRVHEGNFWIKGHNQHQYCITVVKRSPNTLSHQTIGSRKGFFSPIDAINIVDYVLLHLRAILEKPTFDTSRE